MMKGFKSVGVLVFLSVLLPSALLWAGHVVTDEDREWAKEALKREAALKGVASTNTVAVLYFRNETGDSAIDPLSKGLALMLISDLSQVPGLKVVERVKLQALLEEMGLGASGLVEPGTAPRVGRLLRAYWLIEGTLEGAKDRLRALSDLFAVPKGAVVGRPSAQGNLEEVFELEKSLLFSILRYLKVKLTPELEEQLRKYPTRDVRALMAYFRGIDASDCGRYGEAVAFYQRALRIDPEFFWASQALRELEELGLWRPFKARRFLWELRGEASSLDQLAPEAVFSRTQVHRKPSTVSPERVQPPQGGRPPQGAYDKY